MATAAQAIPQAGVGTARNVLLITVDTLRADVLGFAGNTVVETPALDALAAAGRVFTDAHAHNVMTLPSHANILTGLYPYQHGVRHNAGFALPEEVATLATVLQEAGFATAAYVAAFPLDSRFGLARGFDVYDDDFGAEAHEQLFSYSERRGSEVVTRAAGWWRQHDGERRFLWVHLFDPHAPYAPPEPFRSRFARRPYLGEVSAVDSFLAPLLDGFLAGREAPTLIVLTSDHGEGLGEHGELTHGLFAYEPTLKVPLVLWGPGVERGRDSRPAGHVDLVPTILGAAGVEPPPRLPGHSLLAASEAPPEAYYFEALASNLDLDWAPLRGVLMNGKKLIVLPLPELYDLRQDPDESENLLRAERSTAAAMARRLPAESRWPPAPGEVSAEEVARLRSLGYLSGGAARKDRTYTAADDPKNLVALDRKINRMMELSSLGRHRAAIVLGREVLAEESSALVYTLLATAMLKAGDSGDAIALMRRAEEAEAANRELLRLLGLTLVWAGQAEKALLLLEPLAAEETDLEARNHLAVALTALGRYREATAILERIVARDPTNARAWENLSFAAVESASYDKALDYARRAIDLDSGLASSWNNLGVALYNLGRARQAIDAWKRAAELAPNEYETLFNLGVVEAETGDLAAARMTLRRFLESAPSPLYDRQRQRARELLGRFGS